MMRLFRLGFVLVSGVTLLVHCSSSGDGSSGGATPGDDASVDVKAGDDSGGGGGGDDGGSDAPRPPRCDPSKPFANEENVLETNFIIDQSARLSADELTLYYAGYGHDGYNGIPHIWISTRTTSAVPFKDPKRIDEIATDSGEMYPTVTADGLTMYYEGAIGEAGGAGVIKATRASKSAPWGNLTLLSGLQLSMLFVTHDGTRLYGMYMDQIYATPLPYTGQPLEAVASGSPRVYWPVASDDGLTLFFSWPTYSPYQWELLYRTRAKTSDPFGNDKPLTELNTKADEHPTWISPDGCVLYFQRVNASIPGNPAGILRATRGM